MDTAQLNNYLKVKTRHMLEQSMQDRQKYSCELRDKAAALCIKLGLSPQRRVSRPFSYSDD
jgi:hypothetical protein